MKYYLFGYSPLLYTILNRLEEIFGRDTVTMVNTLLALGYAASWGIGITLSKLVLRSFEPIDLLLIQLVSSALFLITVLGFIQGKTGPKQINLRTGVAGILEPGMAYIFGTVGLALTSAVSASLIGTSETVVTILAAAIFLREKLPPFKLFLALIGTAGVVMISGADATDVASRSLGGDILIFIGVLFAVGYAILSKGAVKSVDPLVLVSAQQLCGLLTVLPLWVVIAWLGRGSVLSYSISIETWSLAILSGILQYALAFLLYLTAIRTMDVSKATFFLILIPVFASASAVVILRETIGHIQALGGGVIILSTYLASRDSNIQRKKKVSL